MDGTVEENKMSGAWNHPRRKGDFQVTREVQKAESNAAPEPNLVGLKGDEKKVVEYLLKDWRDWEEDYSITTVDIAMDALRLRPSVEMRFRIGNYVKNHPELDEILRQWGWQTVVLTPSEKLVARAIVNAERDKQKAPARPELARMVGITEKEADDAVRILSRFGILKRDRSTGGVGYIASAPRYLNWQPWLDFQFHRITLSSGRTFCVN
jgi:predicted DNA-binding transcriptional regulator